jgi:hypothetical protein
VCAARDSNPEPADSRHSMGVPTEPRLRSHSECLSPDPPQFVFVTVVDLALMLRRAGRG